MILRRLALLALVASVCAVPGAPEVRQPAPGERAVVSAIDAGLAFLKKAQNPDGSWSSKFAGGGMQNPFERPAKPKPNTTGDFAVTALSVMAFLSAGHVPGEGHYGEAVETGLVWILDHQQKDGRLCPANGTEMYHHGICTLMLAECVGLAPASQADRLRDGLERAVKIILSAQRRGGGRFNQQSMNGGWRYSVGDGGVQGSDLSVTGWQLMALRAAKNVGCDVPAENIQAAVDYVKRSFEARTGAFQYQPGGQTTVACTGVGVLCLELSGKDYHLCDEAIKGGAYILKNVTNRENHFYYGLYYMSQAMFQLGGNHWNSFQPKLHKLALDQFGPERDGSWPQVGDGAMNGSAYATAMAILALTVEYRYLPIYQRFDEPMERDGRD